MVRRKSPGNSSDNEYSELIKLWLLRILVPLNGQYKFVSKMGIENDRLAETLGFVTPDDIAFESVEIKKARARLYRLHAAGEKKYLKAELPKELAENIRRLADLVGLSEIDCSILGFVTLIQNDRLLDDTADWLGQLTTAQVYHALSVILAQPESAIRTALSSKGVLIQSGIVSLDRSGPARLRNKLDLLSSRFAESLLVSEEDPFSLLRDMVTPGSPPELKWRDYEHLGQSLTLMRTYLKHALATRRKGVNIFLYGKPGTGKSQLARLLAQELACDMFEVASEDQDGDPVDGERRLRAFRATQSFFAERKTLIVFDEVEDVFSDGGLFGRRSTAEKHKAWINRALEQNPVPTLWLSNSIIELDNAFIRRFDMVIELQVPTRKQRERIIRDSCGDMLNARGIDRIAASETLTPGVIARAAAVVSAIRDALPEEQVSSAIEHLVGCTLEAQGFEPLRKPDASRLPDYYEVSLVNAGTNLEAVADGLAQTKEGRLCLYGPPGTGKTAFGRWLAEKLGLPLHVKRASDLLSKFVGGTERNIARAFTEASDAGAVLLMDEVDSFLQDRSGAQRSWEVTEVNEMLSQMESFSGILIASTNLMDGLDQAALRRFDLKLKFDYLKPEQAWLLFERQCKALGLGSPEIALKRELECLNVLTPGDFATVARQHRLRPAREPSTILDALKAECMIKGGMVKASIGFV
jgi:SpoVK/Ycf46/Vps4 family AAA+-type ATPase